MADNLKPEQRRYAMSQVKSAHTRPELLVRSMLHGMGYRFRLHDKKLPGSPDIVLPKYKTVIFVNGCFWHQHPGCRKATIPVKNFPYWSAKLKRNTERDRRTKEELEASGWNVVLVWDCEMGAQKREMLSARLNAVLQASVSQAASEKAG